MRITLVLLTALAATAARADDWPQWMGPQRDGVWREDGILDKFPPGGPKVLWKQPCGVGYAGPSVAGGKLYLPDFMPEGGLPDNGFAKGKFVGQERLACREAATGKELWVDSYPVAYTISYPGGPRCHATVDGNKVYTLGAMGDLRCLEAATGKLVWAKNFVKDYEAGIPVWGFAAHPLVDGDKLICLAGGSKDRLVIAFDKNTGKELWTSQSCSGDFGYSPPVIYEFGGKRQLVIWHTRAVVGLEPETGKRIWKQDFDVKFALTAPMARKVGPDGLFVTSFYNGSMFLKVGATSAEVVWKSKAKGEQASQTTDLSSIMPTPVIEGDVAYGVCSYGQLRGLEAKTGTRLWETMQATRGKRTPEKVAAEPTPGPIERWSNAFLTPQGGRYFLFNEQGDLIIATLSRGGYEEIDRATVIEPTNTMAGAGRKVVWVHPAYSNRCVFVRNDREVICLSLAR
ncbi:MAG TPA: PQQ-binding-like beta-propeller repeat protein [Urbifossiella sp.]|jgi:outer membrane protein assembly factor BamB|nr:PQQ-binding-like beta-propeller repeat protein [Urbifossiella sp.]